MADRRDGRNWSTWDSEKLPKRKAPGAYCSIFGKQIGTKKTLKTKPKADQYAAQTLQLLPRPLILLSSRRPDDG